MILLYYTYEYIYGDPNSKTETENYIDFSNALRADMQRQGVAKKDQQHIERIVENIIEKKKKEKNIKSTVQACKTGLIRGMAAGMMGGFISGDYSQIITAGCTYGIVNGFMHHVGE